MVHCATSTRFTSRRNRLCCLLLLLVAGAFPLRAQSLVTAGNQYVSVSAVSDNASSIGGGRFVIDAGPFHGSYRFLYHITSHVVFRIVAGGETHYYTNAKSQFGGQPMVDGTTPIAYRAFDSIYHSGDTIAFGWHGLAGGYSVTMRLIPEKPLSFYDRGSDVLIEFSYERTPGGTSAQLGILMMLDTYNGQAAGSSGGGGDKSSVLTSIGYFPIDRPGKLFRSPADSIPDFYHVGNFTLAQPINTVLPIHRLRRRSNNGLQLTTPELFAVGNWRVLRNVGWNITAEDVAGTNVGDGATITRWSGLQGSGTVRTAFGMDNREGNDIYHCRDASLFVDIESPRVVVKESGDSLFRPTYFFPHMWVTSTATTPQEVTITLMSPIGGSAGGRLEIDASTPASTTISLAPGETKMLRWRLNVVQSITDSLIDVPLDFRYQLTGAQQQTFKLPCTPVITLGRSDIIERQGLDNRAPRVNEINTPAGSITRRYLLFDRHDSFIYDTGIDTITIAENLDGNGAVTIETPGFTRCDTNGSVTLNVRQIDTLRPMRVRFSVRDCAGNVTSQLITLDARPNRIDTMPPGFVRSDSTSTEWRLQVRDRHIGYPFDTGLDSIRVESSLNFELLQDPYTRCDTLASPTITARVINPAQDGFIAIVAIDCRGNARRDTVIYRGTSGVASESVEKGGLAIVELRPQPQRAGRALELRLLGADRGELRGELIAMDGRVAAELAIDQGGISSERAVITLPETLPPGVYLLRLHGARGSAQARIVVIE